ncbi:hypothetical protein Pth03_35370 [Planotetraspora thailandica]|uniref:DUF4439 domain-containing protein n=2 Tax=Planotetraspora thailandica TaxID=487172 RepID=A0A8J3V1M4_9ACTN|nr:hypothetical protein Pth03_35370 [Planotetraspora thailandica]
MAGLIVSGCTSRSEEPAAPRPKDPQVVLLTSLIEAKEQMIALYDRGALAGADLATALGPFKQRHAAHLAAFKKLMPPGESSSPSPSPTASAAASPVSLAKLRDAERRAAAGRAKQMAHASPALAQLLASVGACEAVHAMALGVLRG